MNRKHVGIFDPGVGTTRELSLRVSVAALVRVLFDHPATGERMLALERRAGLVEVKSHPFGGALRIYEPAAVQKLIGDFHFDSQESRLQRDFRLFIRPSAWDALREFCLGQFRNDRNAIFEQDPARELTEEFTDTLGLGLDPDQYFCRAVGTVLEAEPSATEHIYARGYPTVRIYRIFEARLLDASMIGAMLKKSARCTDQELRQLALQDFQTGGPGRANTVLTLSYKEINTFYLAVPTEARNRPIFFQNHQLDETVAAVLDSVRVPKYQRLLS